ncbi:hypothetical protein B0H10DRAFT_1792606, partial [Mycena sp. CBHHK59/15]
KTIDASESAFKPRKVKKSDGKYRDRAEERRVGEGNDYAQVEAVLEDFEKRLGDKNATDEERKYLGGDSDHSILVRGLDVALLEQNKAKASLSAVDDDTLEQAFIAASSAPTVPKKRTREDMIRELKEKRGVKSAVEPKPTEDALEVAKKQGKFKPIGFKPIGAPAEEKPKKKAKGNGANGERKKKKRKVEVPANVDGATDECSAVMPPPPVPEKVADPAPPVPSSSAIPPEDDMPDDFDIFAGAGDYEGIDLGDDDDDDDGDAPNNGGLEEGEEPSELPAAGKWFEQDEPDHLPSTSKLPLPPLSSKPPPPPVDDDEEDGEQPTRLVPLQSSALPSIKDLLAMDKAANSSEKWKKRKDKKKGGKDADGDAAPKKVSAEAKVERDYKRLVSLRSSVSHYKIMSFQRLKNYTDKTASGSTK